MVLDVVAVVREVEVVVAVLCDVAVQAVQLTLFRAYRWRDAQGGPPPGGGNRRGRRRGQPQRPDYDADEYNPLKL